MSVNNNPPIQIAPGTEGSQKDAFINENFRKLSDSLNPFQISDGSNNILNIGKDSSGEYTVKVSKPGFDAFDAADENLIFNSNQNVFKIVATGTISFPEWTIPGNSTNGISAATAAGNFVTVETGLSSVFSVLAFASDGGTTFQFSGTGIAFTGIAGEVYGFFNYYVNTYSGSVDFGRLAYNSNASSFLANSLSIRYYILQETAN